MKVVLRWLYDTWYGALAVSVLTGVLLLGVGMWIGGDRRYSLAVNTLFVVQGAAMLVALSAFVVSLVRRKWLRAALQCGVGLFLAIVFAMALTFVSLCAMFSSENVETFNVEKQPWLMSKMSAEIPFSIEFRRCHPFFSEYDRRIRFRSGKCIGIDEDTGGYREFAVYKIATNEYYVVDKINEEYSDVRHSEYRINVGQETVERRSNRYAWIKVPDDSTSISSYGIGTITVKTADGEETSEACVPVGESLDNICYIGRIYPSGDVELGGVEPKIRREPEAEWKLGVLPEGVPFAFDRQRDGDTKGHSWRLRFASGKALATFSSWSDDERTHLYRMRDGRYLVERYGGCSGKDYYRIDPVGETEDCSWDGCWIPVPDGAISIHHIGPSENKASKDRCVVDVMTKNGPAKGYGGEPMGDMHYGSTYLGYYLEDGRLVSGASRYFEDAVRRAAGMAGSLDGGAENQKFYDLYVKIYAADPKAVRRYVESSGAWQIVDHGHHVCAYRILACGDESCEVRINLTGKPGSNIAARKRCRNPAVMYAAAAWTMLHELGGIEHSGATGR